MTQNKSVEKYRKYVETLMRNIGNIKAYKVDNGDHVYIMDKDIDRMNDWYFYNSLKDCLISKQDEEGIHVITDQFDFVSKSLLTSPLNEHEKADVVFYLINRNINLGGILEEDKVRGLIKYNKFFEYGLSSDVVNDLFFSGEMENLLYSDDSLLDRETLQLKNIAKKCIVLLDQENPFVIAHKTIKNHFLDKMTEYEEEDIIKVHQALLELEMDERTCNVIKVVLQNRLRTRKKCEERENIAKKSQGISKIEPIKKHLSEKEYKKLRKEVLPYFDLYTAMPTRNLSMDEVLYCASLLFMMGEEDHTIKALYDRSSYTKKLLKKAKESPVATYLMVYDQLEFYKEKLEIEDSITLLDSYFQETFLSTPEEYSVWKQAIGEELEDVLEKIPAGYEYELQMKPQYEKGIEKIKARNTKK